MGRSSRLAIALAIVALAAGTAPAQQARAPGFTLERYEPSPVPGLDVLNVFTSRMASSVRLSTALTLSYADDGLTVVRTNADSDLAARLVDEQIMADVAVGVSLGSFITLSASLPIALSRSGDDLAPLGRPGETVEGAAIGDVRVTPRLRFWYPEDAGGFGLVLACPVALPTGDQGRLLSDGAVRARPTLGLDYRTPDGLLVALNAGYHHRPERVARDFVSGPAVTWAVGAEIPTGLAPLSVVASVFGEVPIEANRRDALDPSIPLDTRDVPVDLLAGAQLRLGPFVSTVAFGGAVSGGVGAPDFRASLAFAWVPLGPGRDRDDDGIYDAVDACPDAPEDLDGFADDDGCPEPDNDKDGIPDVRDRCPDAPEDIDGFEDIDGCPDPDNDGDGNPDATDACPNDAEDVDGFEDEDGCPDVDNDGDGIPDAMDACPHEAEDLDGYQDGDGCVEPDNDKDGIFDVNDACPDFPETFNGLDDEDGCPDSPTGDVRVGRTDIAILRKIHFTRNGKTIERRSYSTLDAVANIILSNAEITLIRIEGHTDDLGDPEENLEISQARADAVMAYLIRRGVNPEILTAKGFGAIWPIADDETPVGRAQNRRVEFRILEVAGKPVISPVEPHGAPAPTPPR